MTGHILYSEKEPRSCTIHNNKHNFAPLYSLSQPRVFQPINMQNSYFLSQIPFRTRKQANDNQENDRWPLSQLLSQDIFLRHEVDDGQNYPRLMNRYYWLIQTRREQSFYL